jgi:glycosyltransferase involved in cell wall biosynthesis
MKLPNVSVIITTCNRSNQVQRAIQSVLEQDYNNFDLHIVDDASEDETHALLATTATPRET